MRAFKYLPFIIGLVILTFLSHANSIDNQQEKCDILGTELNSQIIFRQEPGFSNKIIAKITLADIQTIKKIRVSNDEQWLNVKINKQTGWINTRYIRCRHSPQSAQSLISESAKKAISAIKNNDWKKLALLAHPEKGIRFSPTVTIDLKNDQVIKASELHKAFYSPFKRAWGTKKEGARIAMTFAAYTQQYLRKYSYWNANTIRYNQFENSINNPNNLVRIYPHSIITEFRITGLDPKTQGTSTSSLYLIFEESEFEWRLVGIVHAR